MTDQPKFSAVVPLDKMPPCPICGDPLIYPAGDLVVFVAHGRAALVHDGCKPKDVPAVTTTVSHSEMEARLKSLVGGFVETARAENIPMFYVVMEMATWSNALINNLPIEEARKSIGQVITAEVMARTGPAGTA